MSDTLLIGWDVGGWNCDRNRLSRDALVVLDDSLHIRGKPWRGNLRSLINQAKSTPAFIRELLANCQVVSSLSDELPVVLGIDTPLGFSSELIDLLVNRKPVPAVESSSTNPYLFRFTERFLFERGLSPLSSIKDMIGSQATKGMHVLGRFMPHAVQCGVWSDNACASAIEVYPSSAKRSMLVNELRLQCLQRSGVNSAEWHEDEQDALTCALLAWLYKIEPGSMVWPPADTPYREGWIFVPKDCLVGDGEVKGDHDDYPAVCPRPDHTSEAEIDPFAAHTSSLGNSA